MNRFVPLIFILLLGIGHCQEEHAHEFAGVFGVGSSPYTYVAAKVDGAYAEPTLNIVFLPASSGDAEGIEAAEEEAETLFAGTPTPVSIGGTLVPNQLFQLTFDDNFPESLFSVGFPTTGFFVVFTEHSPYEFLPAGGSPLLTSEGEAVRFVATEPATGAKTQKELAILAAFIVAVVSLTGLLLFLPGVALIPWGAFAGALASGAILAAAVFFVLPEGYAYINSGFTEENEVAWRWGTMILVGFITPILIHYLFSGFGLAVEDLTGESDKEADLPTDAPTYVWDVDEYGQPVLIAVEKGVEDGKYDLTSCGKLNSVKGQHVSFLDWSRATTVVWSLTIGEILHNFVDGVLIGAAFKICTPSVGWAVAGGAALHELTQELADFLVYTTVGGLTILQAFSINFISSLSVILGAIIIVYTNIDNVALGMLLAFGGGVYLYVGTIACWPRLLRPASWAMIALRLFLFSLGAVALGLVLLFHEHCEVDSSGGGGGHAH